MSFSAQHIRQARLHLRRSDPVMKGIIQQVGPFTARVRRDRFGTLAGSIVSQQISGQAARSIWQRLEQLTAPAGVTADSIDALSVPRLRSVGVSRQKATYLLDLAHHVLEENIVLSQIGRKADEDVISQLTRVKGIGRWTAQMFLIFSLGRLDVLPVDDLGVKSAVQKQYRLRQVPSPKKVTQIARPWRPYASVAIWYLWRSLEQPAPAALG